jgi:cellulose synthase/poly-beta-1,6-N-acetylglucosamine synthase-like glycosyltransferase
MTSFDQIILDYIYPFIRINNFAITGYFVFINIAYIFMLMIAFNAIRKYSQHVQSLEMKNLFLSPFAKPVSLLVPAYNEEASIVESVKSILQLQYPTYEIVLINDGSTDSTLDKLISSFDLIKTKNVYRPQLPCNDIRGIYESSTYSNLIVVDKANGGKADSLNAGINVSKYPLICSLDADSVLESDVLLKIVRPFMEDQTTVAAGGSIRIANGCEIFNGRVTKIGLPKSLLGKFQVMEYLRSFLAGRVAFSIVNALIIISGAFGVFKKDKVIEIGGYKTGSVGEDMELVLRLHARLREKKEPYNITFIPDPVCWTEAPENLKVLGLQRRRWQRGLLESLLGNKQIFFNPRYGIIGFLAYPFFLIAEGLGPIIEVLGFVLFAASWYFDMVAYPLIYLFVLATIVLNILLSIGSIIFEEMTYQRYPNTSMILKLIGLSFIEVFVYRPLTVWYRLVGLFEYFTGKKGGWGEMVRKGFQEQQEELAQK